jgi:hypothetical protein
VAVDIKKDQSKDLELVTDGSWTSPTCEVLDPDGSTLSTPSATLDSTATTVASAASSYQLTLTSASGFVVGRWYKVATDGVTSLFKVIRISSNDITLSPALSITPEASDPVTGVNVSVTVPAASTGDLGTGYQVILSEGGKEERLVFNVVRRLFIDSIRAHHIRQMVINFWPSYELSELEYEDLSQAVQDEMRDELIATGRYPHIYADPNIFKTLGLSIARRLLAIRHSLYPPDAEDRQMYLEDLERERQRYLARIIGSLQAKDADNDGDVDSDDMAVFAIKAGR